MTQASSRITRDELVAMLAKSLGEETSRQVIHDGMRQLGCAGEALSVKQAIRVLEGLVEREEDGIVSAVARFAKARLLLRARPTRPPGSL